MKITLKDLAKKADVSPSTVSLVINGKGNIPQATREHVLKVIDEMNYTRKPDRKQQTATSPKSIKFLRIAKHHNVLNRAHDVFISDYIEGLTQGASELGYRVEILSFSSEPIVDIIGVALHDDAVSGAIILATELTDNDMALFRMASIPIVFIDNYHEYLPFDFVDMDNKDSVYRAIVHCAERGFKEIGLIASTVETKNFKLRENAYIEIMSHSYPSLQTGIVRVSSLYQEAYEDMKRHLSGGYRPFESYLCCNDIIAMGSIKAFIEAGFRVPKDISVFGFDNLPQAALTEPHLSTISVSKRQIAKLAIQLLDKRIADPSLPNTRALISGDIILRETIRPETRP